MSASFWITITVFALMVVAVMTAGFKDDKTKGL